MKVLKSMFIISLLVFIQFGGIFAQGVVISDDAGASTIADEAAVLDAQSTSNMVIEADATATASSFAVGRFTTAKGMDETYLSVIGH